MSYVVTEKAMRPASCLKQCFYCNQKIGEIHKKDCVLIKKKILVKAVIEYEIEVPAYWGKENIEFHRNEGSWCSNNMIDELQEIIEEKGCLCGNVEFEYLKDKSTSYLEE